MIHNNKLISGVTRGVLSFLFLALLAFRCSSGGGGDNGNGQKMFGYVCPNGTPVTGRTGTPDTERCLACNDGHWLDTSNTACKATSTVAWTARMSGPGGVFNDVTHGGSQFVVVGWGAILTAR